MQYVLGVDGGNTKTIAIVAALDGTILGTGRGGCGDIYNASIDGTNLPNSAAAAIANIEYAIADHSASRSFRARGLNCSPGASTGPRARRN